MTNESGEAGRREGSSGREKKREIGKRERAAWRGGVREKQGCATRATLTNFFYGLNKVDDEDARHGNSFFVTQWRRPGVHLGGLLRQPSTGTRRFQPLTFREDLARFLQGALPQRPTKVVSWQSRKQSLQSVHLQGPPGPKTWGTATHSFLCLLEIPHIGLTVLDWRLKSSHWAIRTAD